MFKYVMSVFVISLICTSPSLADPNKSAPKYPTPECSKDLSPYVELESVLKVPSDYIDKCITTSGYIDTTTQTFSLENDSLSAALGYSFPVTIKGTELVKTANTKGLNDQTQWLHRHFIVRAKLKSCKTNGVEQAFFCQSNKGAVYLDISSYIHIKDIDLQRFLQPINLKKQTDSCSLDVAKEVALAEILDSAETYNGQCILTTGYADERAIFTKRPSKGEDLKAIRMGLYTNKYNRKLLLGAGKLTKVKILGVVGMCKDLYGPTTVEVFASKDKVEAITLPFVFGYCHYVVGPFINSVTIQKLET